MARKHYLLCACLLMTCVGLVIAILALQENPPGVTKTNFDRINKGMTMAEVETLFGRQSAQAEAESALAKLRDKPMPKRGGRHVWGDLGSGIAQIQFDFDPDEPTVVDSEWMDDSETFFHKVGRWLHLV